MIPTVENRQDPDYLSKHFPCGKVGQAAPRWRVRRESKFLVPDLHYLVRPLVEEWGAKRAFSYVHLSLTPAFLSVHSELALFCTNCSKMKNVQKQSHRRILSNMPPPLPRSPKGQKRKERERPKERRAKNSFMTWHGPTLTHTRFSTLPPPPLPSLFTDYAWTASRERKTTGEEEEREKKVLCHNTCKEKK